MSTTEVGAIGTNASQQIQSASEPQKSDKSLLQMLKEKLVEGKKYVLNYISTHKETCAKIGQIGGTAALVVGGASMLFSGLAANLTIGGIPLGIPLMVAGGILLAAGTVLQVMHQIEKENTTVGEKIKGFFQDTFNNLKFGVIAGVGVAAACAAMPLSQIVTIAPVIIKLKPYLSKDLNKEENWKGFVESFPEDSKIRKTLKDTKTLNDLLNKLPEPIKSILRKSEETDKTATPTPTPLTSADLTEIAATSLALGVD